MKIQLVTTNYNIVTLSYFTCNKFKCAIVVCKIKLGLQVKFFLLQDGEFNSHTQIFFATALKQNLLAHNITVLCMRNRKNVGNAAATIYINFFRNFKLI